MNGLIRQALKPRNVLNKENEMFFTPGPIFYSGKKTAPPTLKQMGGCLLALLLTSPWLFVIIWVISKIPEGPMR
jgi:hypothetical protein